MLQVCHLVLHSVMRDGLRVVTVREKFQMANLMSCDVLVQCHALPVQAEKVSYLLQGELVDIGNNKM